MIRKLILALAFILPSLAFAVDMDGFYITAKGGISKTMDTGVTTVNNGGTILDLYDDDLGTGSAFGFSAGKYFSDNFRLELELIKRTGYEYDADYNGGGEEEAGMSLTGDLDSTSIFVNGFYDFQPFSISNTAITPYLGGGIGISRNKTGVISEYTAGVINGTTVEGDTVNQFAYKLSAGTLVSLTKQLSLDVNYQYVNLGSFKSGVRVEVNGEFNQDLVQGVN
ncbi:outer membrane beta-barrel protein, partial [Methylophilaceae bacterium]|nr:outer membrane beta-barrel protein [Methylophilaceae bacterium]